MKQRIVKLACLVLLLPLSATSWAMEQLDDSSLAAATGQDGIDVKLNFTNSTIYYDQVALYDRDGMGAPSAAAAGLVVSPWYYTTTGGGIQMLDGAGQPVSGPIKISIDADANDGVKPLANIAIALPTDLRKINLKDFSIYLSPDVNNIYATRRVFDGAYQAKRAEVRELLAISTVGVSFAANGAPKMIMQLGTAPQGHMLMFTGGLLQQISTSNIDIVSMTSTNVRVNLSLGNLSFAASGYPTNSSATFGLNGFYMDTADDGIVFGKVGATDKFDLTIGSIKAGTSSDTNYFNGLGNGSMGGVGIIGASVTNLQVNVKGL